MEKRKTPRYKRRLPLRFWSQESSSRQKAFTKNISETGVYVATNSPFSVGTLITIELPLDNRLIILEGQVRSSIRVDPSLRKWKQSGMGVRLLTTEEVMRGIIRPNQDQDQQETIDRAGPDTETADSSGDNEKAALFSIYIDTSADLARVFESHIKHGGIFVPTAAAIKTEEQIHLEFLFKWAPKTMFQTSGKVVRTFLGDGDSESVGGVPGIGVAFSDPRETIAHFRQLLCLPDHLGTSSRHP